MPLDLALRHDELDQREAALHALLAHPVRLRLLHVLAASDGTLADLAARLAQPLGEIEEHVARLREAGLVRRARGRHGIADRGVADALMALRRLAYRR